MKIIDKHKVHLGAIPVVMRIAGLVQGKDEYETEEALRRNGEERDEMHAQRASTATALSHRQHAAMPVDHTIELRHHDKGRTLFRVPEWKRPPEIIEWSGRRFVKYANNQYREAVTFSLYVGYNAETVQEGVAKLKVPR